MTQSRATDLRVRGRDVRDALLALVPVSAALLFAAWILPGLTIAPWWAAVLVAAVMALADAVLRPVLRLRFSACPSRMAARITPAC